MPPLLHLERSFPKLRASGYDENNCSPYTGGPLVDGTYNCIAWAAEDVHHKFWWPSTGSSRGHWPWCVSRSVDVPCFISAFRCLGYFRSANSRLEFGYDKVALFAIHASRTKKPIPAKLSQFADWIPTHMARQLRDGNWTSKCGWNEDITHYTLDALESYIRSDAYGCPVLYMKRPIPISWLVRFFQWLFWKIESMF